MKNIDRVIQYLHWALIAAHKEANPDCRQVRITVDLVNQSTRTSFTKIGSGPGEGDPKVLRDALFALLTGLIGSNKKRPFNTRAAIATIQRAMRTYDGLPDPIEEKPRKARKT